MPSLKTFLSGGDFLSEQRSCQATRLFRKHGAKNAMICNGSGNGELLGCCTNAMGYEYRPDTVGKLIVGPKYLIVDNNDQEVPSGKEGELLVSGKHVFKEYYKNPEQTQKSMVRIDSLNYYRTGNYGYVDTNGFFILVDRASHFYINSSFKKVYCGKVQKAVNTLESIVQGCAVVPMPDKEMRYVSKAFIVLQPGVDNSDATKDQIIYTLEHSLDRAQIELKDYEIPRSITFVDALPRTKADKVDYEVLKKRAEQEVQKK